MYIDIIVIEKVIIIIILFVGMEVINVILIVYICSC